MKNIIIVGGGMSNKGAQSMTFITVDELRKKYPQDRIVLLTSMPTDNANYQFDVIKTSRRSVQHILDGEKRLRGIFNRVNLEEVKEIREVFSNARLLIDISGYALSSKWADPIVNYYLIMLECAAKFHVPAYVFPQSFGPFDYKGAKGEKWLKRIQKIMEYPKVIFAREIEGRDALVQTFHLKNVRLSRDMVIINKEIDADNIYKNYKIQNIDVASRAVAILPNMRNYEHGEKEEVLRFYRTVVAWLLEKGYNIYLLRHSSEDLQACREIKEMFPDEKRLRVLGNDLECLEYERLVRKFRFIIASRYHSIIHAYRCNVPCVALGWATKYKDLLSAFEQDQYMFDVRIKIESENVQQVLGKMEQNCEREKVVIAKNLAVIQENNIFDVIEE